MKQYLAPFILFILFAHPAFAGYRVTNSHIQEKTVSVDGSDVTMRMLEAYFLNSDTNDIQLILAFSRKDGKPFQGKKTLTLTNSDATRHRINVEYTDNNVIAYSFLDKNILDSHTTATLSTDGFDFPMDTARWTMTHDFNLAETSGLCSCEHYHTGQDYFFNDRTKRAGQTIRAIADGQLIYIKDMGTATGLHLVLRHALPNGETVDSSYVHLASLCKKQGDAIVRNDTPKVLGNVICSIPADTGVLTPIYLGDTVKEGDAIGQTAEISAPHLHLEVRRNPQEGQGRSLTLAAPTQSTIMEFNSKASLISNGSFYLNAGCGFGCYTSDPVLDGFVKASEFISANRSVRFEFDLVLFQY